MQPSTKGKVQPAGRQELATLNATNRALRAIQEEATEALKALRRAYLPPDVATSEVVNAQIRATSDALFEIHTLAGQCRDLSTYRAAGNSKQTNDATATLETALWRREGNKSKGTGT